MEKSRSLTPIWVKIQNCNSLKKSAPLIVIRIVQCVGKKKTHKFIVLNVKSLTPFTQEILTISKVTFTVRTFKNKQL